MTRFSARLLRRLFASWMDAPTRQPHKPFRPQVEQLEDMVLPSALQPFPTYETSAAARSDVVHPSLNPLFTPPGLSPSQVRAAYGINGITFAGGTVTGDGTGQTIAIVDAFDDPNIASDLATFDSQFSIAAPPNFIKVGVNTSGVGSLTSLPSPNGGWAGEIALDVEWAHAIAPGATILLVEAANANDSSLMTAVDFARNYTGQFGGTATSVVSMSWGGGEDSTELSDDTHFTTPSGHTGVTFFASAGDSGAPAGYPATSSHVVAVGGTTLSTDSAGDYLGESGWSGGGGGFSSVESQPGYQNGLVIHNGTQLISANGARATPDVAYDANPNTGVAILDSYGFGGWVALGGTSAGSPQWAALTAIADQGRVQAGNGTLDGFTQTLPLLYQLSAADFHDVTTGSNGYSAGPGFDLVTGRGTPVAGKLIPDLVSGNTGGGTSQPPTFAQTAEVLSSTPTTVALSALGSDPAGESLTYTWSAINNPPAAVTFSPNGTTAASNTTATLTKAGTYTFQVTITDTSGLTASSQVSFTVSQVLTSVAVSPASATVIDGNTQQFSASGKDQFGAALTTQPSFSWSIDAAGLGTVSTAGLYQAPASGSGSATVRATSGGVSGTAGVTVSPAPTGPTITTAAHIVSQTPTAVMLSVAANDPAGALALTYTWSLSGTPPAGVSFSVNGSNGAASTTATFGKAGVYNFVVTVKDPSNLTTTSQVTVMVSAMLTSITVSPASATVIDGNTQQFSASGKDQFGAALTTQPSFSWSIDAGGLGTVSSAGLYQAPPSGSGGATVRATSGGVSGTASVTVSAATPTGPTITTAAHVITQTPTTATLSVAATDPAGASTLIYTWYLTGTPPGSVTASVNGSNVASTATMTFSAAGTYNFVVTVSDPSHLSATSTLAVTVNAVLTSIMVGPSLVTLAPGATQQFSAFALDQFGHGITPPPAFAWSVVGAGSITSTGVFTAGSSSATVVATSGSVKGQTSVTVTAPGTGQTFPAPSLPAPIWSGYALYSHLTVNQDITIGSLSVTLNITYAYDGYLALDLLSPQGTDISLARFRGTGANFLNTTFSDQAAVGIASGSSPFAGSYRPEKPLAALAGLDIRGTWTLVVSDYGPYYGQLNSWSLTVQPATAPSAALPSSPHTATALTAALFTTSPSNGGVTLPPTVVFVVSPSTHADAGWWPAPHSGPQSPWDPWTE